MASARRGMRRPLASFTAPSSMRSCVRRPTSSSARAGASLVIDSFKSLRSVTSASAAAAAAASAATAAASGSCAAAAAAERARAADSATACRQTVGGRAGGRGGRHAEKWNGRAFFLGLLVVSSSRITHSPSISAPRCSGLTLVTGRQVRVRMAAT
eukprot:174170-Chlamydomonas_euryale.AAC.1